MLIIKYLIVYLNYEYSNKKIISIKYRICSYYFIRSCCSKYLKYSRTFFTTSFGQTIQITTLQTAVNDINAALENKQDKLTAGAGITITSDGVISVTANAELYKIVTSLPTASKSCENTIYLVPSSGALGNLFTEYLCVYEPTQSQYIWEKIGTLSTDVDLSNYVTKDEFDIVKGQLANTITAQNVTTSGGSQVVVSYEIPTTLYDSAVSTDTSDQIVSG